MAGIEVDVVVTNYPQVGTVVTTSDPLIVTIGPSQGGVITADTEKGDCDTDCKPKKLSPGTHWDFSMTAPDCSACGPPGIVIPVQVQNDNPDTAIIYIVAVQE